MSKVFFVEKERVKKINDILRNLILDNFAAETEDFAEKDVLVKLNMGERGNKWYVKPEFVKIVTDELKNIGLIPFIYDTAILYGGQRDTQEKYMDLAVEHGFDKIGCDVVIGNRGAVYSFERGRNRL